MPAEELEDDETDNDEDMMEPSDDRPNHCPGCERYVSDDEWVRYYDHCEMCCEDPDIQIEGMDDDEDDEDDDDFDDEEDDEDDEDE